MELPALEAMRSSPAGAALFVDYDGTLAPIVSDPAGARPVPGVVSVLGRLSERLALVAVVSGRPLSYLTSVLGRPGGVHLVGLYGMEEADRSGKVRVEPAAEAWRGRVEASASRARREAPTGIEVEAKGLTFTLHWRAAPDAAGWAEGFARDEQQRSGLVGQPGRMALELRPPLATDKGTVVDRLAGARDPIAYFGDDLGDLPAFAALDRLAAAGRQVARVAVIDAESPPTVAAAADVAVDGPVGALRLLEQLLG